MADGAEDVSLRAEKLLIADIVSTIQSRLGADADERLRQLKSVNTFLKEDDHVWEVRAEEPCAPLGQTDVSGRREEANQAVGTAESSESQTDCADLQNKVNKLQGNKAVKQETKGNLTSKLQDLTANEDTVHRLTEEIRVLKARCTALDKENEEIADQIQRKKKLTQNCLDLEAERDSVRQEVDVKQKRVAELKERAPTEEQALDENQLRNDLEVCRRALDEEEDRLQSELLQQDDVKRQCEDKEAEIKSLHNELEARQEAITQMISKAVQGSYMDLKHIQLVETKEVKKSEIKEMETYLKKYDKIWEEYMTQLPMYEEEIREDEDMRKENDAIERKTAHLKREIRNAKAKEDSYKATIEGGAGLKAKNKKLLKEQQVLEKQLLKLQLVEQTHEKQQKATDASSQENRRLHEEVASLEEKVTRMSVVKAKAGRLAREEASLNSSNDSLRKRIVGLQNRMKQLQPLQAEISDYKERINDLQLDFERIQKKHEDVTVSIGTHEVSLIIERALGREVNALATVNKTLGVLIKQKTRNAIAEM